MQEAERKIQGRTTKRDLRKDAAILQDGLPSYPPLPPAPCFKIRRAGQLELFPTARILETFPGGCEFDNMAHV